MSYLTGHFVLATSYSRTAYRRTTIGAAAFHFRVRNGNGWCHHANVTRGRNRTGGSLLSQRRKREAESLETAIEVNRHYVKSNFKRTLNTSSHHQLIRWFADIYIQEEECDSRFVTLLHRVLRFTFNVSPIHELQGFVLF